MTDNACKKTGLRKMIKRFSKLTGPVIIAGASLTFVLSPSVGLANTRAESKAHQAKVIRSTAFAKLCISRSGSENRNHGRSLEQLIQDHTIGTRCSNNSRIGASENGCVELPRTL